MRNFIRFIIGSSCCILLVLFSHCKNDTPKLFPVSVADFTAFVEATGYVTDAEKFDWSIVQLDVVNFMVRYGIDWRCPDGLSYARPEYPITQVSYNDALAYCQWAGGRLPSYEEFWQLSQKDTRPVVESAPQIFPLEQVNIIGNVWDMTITERADAHIRLAGGSYLCNKNTCNGTSSDRVLFIDKMTGNTHISFSILMEE